MRVKSFQTVHVQTSISTHLVRLTVPTESWTGNCRTSLGGVDLVNYDNFEQPDKDFSRGSCPGVPGKCRFSTSSDENACCDRKISSGEECGCPNNKLFKVHESYPGYRDPSLELPTGYCSGVSAWCKRIQNTHFSKDFCCGGDCPCTCTSPQNCQNPAVFAGHTKSTWNK